MRNSSQESTSNRFLPGEGNVFTGVCHSVHGGGVCLWREGCLHGGDKPLPEIRSTGSRYASYWNAFLLKSEAV